MILTYFTNATSEQNDANDKISSLNFVIKNVHNRMKYSVKNLGWNHIQTAKP